MTTAIVHAFKPTRSRVLTVVFLLAILFGCYGLLSAQQARSATTLPKHVWGGIQASGTIQHQKHITAVSHPSTGEYLITFDRHIDNCSLQVTNRNEGTVFLGYSLFTIQPVNATNVDVFVVNPGATASLNVDFDIFGMCPSS
jgi:hypothetical protein